MLRQRRWVGEQLDVLAIDLQRLNSVARCVVSLVIPKRVIVPKPACDDVIQAKAGKGACPPGRTTNSRIQLEFARTGHEMVNRAVRSWRGVQAAYSTPAAPIM